MPPGQRKPWMPPVWLFPVLGLVGVVLGVLNAWDGNWVALIGNAGLVLAAVLHQVSRARMRRDPDNRINTGPTDTTAQEHGR